jgi:ribosomal protein L32
MTGGRTFDADALRGHLAAAHRNALHPTTKRRLELALRALDPDLPAHLRQCETCGKVGLPERIDEHEC